MRILVTAIGSMSAACAISRLKDYGNYVVGCDIYPGYWHAETLLCDRFYRAPYATEREEYIRFLISVCMNEDIKYVVPLTDLEIDVINGYREKFEDAGIILCMQKPEILDIVRNKYRLFKTFESDSRVPSVKTCLLSHPDEDMRYPCIAKPYDGRSSEGLIRNADRKLLQAITDKDRYIVQEQIDGNVFTVDYCRSATSGTDCAVPREELLRTRNGAGITIRTSSDMRLVELVSYIGNVLNINGCVNMEFIFDGQNYYLIDINPRFSAGIAFSVMSGYDMVNSHMKCFLHEEIEGQIALQERTIVKKYVEEIMYMQ